MLHDQLCTSQVTFLYFEDMPAAFAFFDDTLGLERIFSADWVGIWRTCGSAFLGAVAIGSGLIEVQSRGEVMVSFTVRGLEAALERLTAAGMEGLSIHRSKALPMRSVFFTGPEGYRFELQQFYDGPMRDLL